MYAQGQQRPGYGQPQHQPQQGYQPPSYYPPQPAAYQNPNQASNYGTAHEPLKTSNRSASLPSGDEMRFQPAGCRDFIWALLFIIHFIGMIILAIVMFRKYKDNMTHSDNTNTQNTTNTDDDLKLNTHGWVLIVILLVCSFFVAALWLSFMQRFPRQLIWFCLIWSCVTTFAFAAFFFAKGEIVPAIIFAIFGALNVLYVYMVRHRVAFSATMLEVMSKVIKQYPSTVGVAAGGILFQAAWVFIWSIGAGTTLYAIRNDTSMNPNVARLIYAFLILSFYWSSQVIVNVVHVTVAGTVASWYFLYPDAMPVHPTLKSLKRATWSSFGSICLGSLIVAVIKTARYMVNAARDTKHEIIRCIILCLLDCLDRMVQFFNTYAYTQVAIYGKNYCEAAQDTWQLLKGRGWDLVINSDLTGSVLALGSVVGGCIVAIIGGIFASVVWKMPLWGVWAMLGFFIGFVVSQLAMEVMRSAIACMYVCYAEDPNALQHTKPHIYDQFTGNIRANYPGVYTGSVQHV